MNTRLTRLLGETYRSSEAAIKELVDNAWDADASNVWIVLPGPMSGDQLTICDDGSGMTGTELRKEYLNIASDKRARVGDRTLRFKRKIKGRKGIGKFAGLMVAERMEVSAVARGRRSTLLIDKKHLLENPNDLESVPLPYSEEEVPDQSDGTTITLSALDSRLNFPTPERLREVLIYEYGREDGFRVHVNDVPLSVSDVPGPTKQLEATLKDAGPISLRFTVADGRKLPRLPGIIIKVDGKAVGKPSLMGLDEDEEIPSRLARRVFGEVDASGLLDDVTADWGAIVENSRGFHELQEAVRQSVKEQLKQTHASEMGLQKARLKQQINQRLQRLPEYRRKFAEEALNRILQKFYGESDERIGTIVNVAISAMEHDEYWVVLEQIGDASRGDIHNFAESLGLFGLLELSRVASQSKGRLNFLDYLEQLVSNHETLEKDAHKALEGNLWILGRSYSSLASNVTLRNIVQVYCNKRFGGDMADKRPDLLLSEDNGDAYLLIEFKRPSHSITRDDISQAQKYRDELLPLLSHAKKFDILLIGKGRADKLDMNDLPRSVSINSYLALISAARSDLSWLLKSVG